MTCEVHCGDMLDLLPRWTAEGFTCDAIISDPPYHLASIAKRFGKEGSAPAQFGKDGAAARLSRGFMGSSTDEGTISFQPETWKACLDALASGGRALVFGGARTWWKTAAAMDAAGFEIEDTIMWIYGQGLVLRRSRLKPCFEPIIMGRKKGPVRDLNIDECRVPSKGRLLRVGDYKDTTNATYSGRMDDSLRGGSKAAGTTDEGRWPSNLIHDGSDEVLACLPDAPGQIAKAAEGDSRRKTQHVYGDLTREPTGAEPREDSGSAARFFTECRFDEDERRLIYEGKAPSSERIFRCARCGEHAFRRDREKHTHDMPDQSHLKEHPTQKPTSLLIHLCKLVVPPGGLVLDPFSGTFTTCVAALKVGRNAVGIEKDPIHCETGRFRISAALSSLKS